LRHLLRAGARQLTEPNRAAPPRPGTI
jgi:hypothetical protein